MTETQVARANGNNLPISPKQAIMVCAYLRGKPLNRAKAILEAVLQKKEAIPFTRFTNGLGHRKGIAAAGRYPQKASMEILALLKSAEANAVNMGLAGELTVKEIRANRASRPMKHGRQSRRQAKRAHVHVVLSEQEVKAKQSQSKKQTKTAQQEKKTEAAEKKSQ